jgi:glutamine amidotransferase
MTPSVVGLVDYGAGNFASVRNALEHVGAHVRPVRTAADLDSVDRLVLPGVGAFAACMRRLEQSGLVDPLKRELFHGDRPFLGICVGMQLLSEWGREFEDHPGLGAIAGEVARIPAEADGLRLPHIGWNEVHVRADSPLLHGLGERPYFYFVHSYAMTPADPDVVLATTDYGTPVTAAVGDGRVHGVQFHPEKSQRAGLRLLQNFACFSTA